MKTEIKKIEYLENEKIQPQPHALGTRLDKSFLDEKKTVFIIFQGQPFSERKKLIKNSGYKLQVNNEMQLHRKIIIILLIILDQLTIKRDLVRLDQIWCFSIIEGSIIP